MAPSLRLWEEEEDERRSNLLVERDVVVVWNGKGGDNGGFRSLEVSGKEKSEVEIAIVAELSSKTEI